MYLAIFMVISSMSSQQLPATSLGRFETKAQCEAALDARIGQIKRHKFHTYDIRRWCVKVEPK